jgi:hypothetical protein
MMSDDFVPIEKLLPFPDPVFSKKVLEMFDDTSLAWWRESLKHLKPPPPDDEPTATE